MMPRYECDSCGACCQGHLIVEAYQIDVLREPRLISADPNSRGHSLSEALDALDDEDRCLILAANRPCALLGGDNRCTIYPTRPNGCIAMQAGSEQCQYARGAAGLPPLEPILKVFTGNERGCGCFGLAEDRP